MQYLQLIEELNHSSGKESILGNDFHAELPLCGSAKINLFLVRRLTNASGVAKKDYLLLPGFRVK